MFLFLHLLLFLFRQKKHLCICVSLLRAIQKLNGYLIDNTALHVSYIPDESCDLEGGQRGHDNGRRSGYGPRSPRGGHPSSGMPPKHTNTDIPLRVLVPTQYVGAIIGKEGATIRNITKQTQSKWVTLIQWCRISIHRCRERTFFIFLHL